MLNVIILAAGKGKRMKSLDENRSKVTYEILEKPMISYVVDCVKLLSPTNIVAVLGVSADKVKALLPSDVLTSLQEKQLGTAHAVLTARELLAEASGCTLVLCGDTPCISDSDLSSLISLHAKENNSLTFITTELDNPTGYGRVIKDDGKVVKIVEQKDATAKERATTLINSGIYLFDNKLLFKHIEEIKALNAQGEYYLTDLVSLFISHGYRVNDFQVSDFSTLIGVNSLVDLAAARKVVQRNINNKHLQNGVQIIDPENTYIGQDVVIGADTIIYPGNEIYGKSIIESNVHLGPNNYLKDVYLKNSCSVTFSHLVEAQIGAKSTVGPFARMRQGVLIGEKCRVGNFVELKSTTFGDETKCAHLTYIGDTVVGTHTNIGCGTITANYDGVNKFATKIGDDVFVGSGSILISPVSIASNSFIAAGSTLNHDVEEGEMAIARAQQINKKGYAKVLKDKAISRRKN